jgi:ribosomal protein L29
MTNMETIRKQSDKDLVETIQEARKDLREERFKDKFSRKANVIRSAKTTIARALTELSTRRNNEETK